MKWFRQWTALLLCCALLSGGAAGASGIDTLSVLSQMDERLLGDAFQYRGMDLRFGGCGPSSVTNALIGTLNVTDFKTAASLLYDVMHFMSSDPSQHDIDSDRLWALGDQQRLERFATLSGLLAAYQGHIQTLSRRFNGDDIRRVLDDGAPTLFISRTTIGKKDWSWLRDIVELLYTGG